ncbi:phage major capsid protein [Rhodopseudomonas parapalustris]
MSKELRELYNKLRQAQDKAQNLMANDAATIDEINAVNKEIDQINAKINMQKTLDAGKNFDENGVEVSNAAQKPGTQTVNKYASTEYRQAFMDYVKSGKASNILEFKAADQSSSTSDVGAIIPSTILQEVIKKVESYGQIFAMVRKTGLKGGVKVPISALKPVATWIGENTSGEKQKVDLSNSVSFTYYGLECKIATSIIADTVTLDQFESILIDLIGEAMTKALDIAIVKGAGSASPLGIVNDSRIPSNHIITLSSTDFVSWEGWKKKVFAKMPLSYKAGASILMASGTFEGYIDGMTDANGQPIGRINYGITNGPQESFGGKPVVEVEDDVIANYDDASTGDVVAIYGNLGNYAINSNMTLTMFRYLDHDTNEYVDKAILIADGKVLDANGFIIVKKGA